ncbi:MAG: efflux RND transporter periplasmic adaptor subunit [Steroidobacteraceae bacterium]
MTDPLAPPLAAISDARLRKYAWIAVAIALVLAVWGIVGRVSARNTLIRQTAVATVATVATVKPTFTPGSEALVLPGSVQANYEAPIYARTNGYLRAWHTDIGTPVKKGQLLAEIESPEVDRQLSQAEADLATAQANYLLAKSTDVRWQGLLATESVSRQDAEQRAGDAAAKKAAVQSAAANVARLREMESFERVLAPFDGVVTQRNTDIGALINAGQSPGAALFRVADTHRLRIYVSVPQPYAASIRPGMSADLKFGEHPDKHYPAAVAFTAQALDPASRTLQVQLQAENPRHELFPGAYAEVHFNLATAVPILRLPANVVLFRAQGLVVAAVGGDHRIRLKRIDPGRDFGSSIEVLSGVGAADDIVINPPDSIADGALVRVVAAPGGGGAGPARP